VAFETVRRHFLPDCLGAISLRVSNSTDTGRIGSLSWVDFSFGPSPTRHARLCRASTRKETIPNSSRNYRHRRIHQPLRGPDKACWFVSSNSWQSVPRGLSGPGPAEPLTTPIPSSSEPGAQWADGGAGVPRQRRPSSSAKRLVGVASRLGGAPMTRRGWIQTGGRLNRHVREAVRLLAGIPQSSLRFPHRAILYQSHGKSMRDQREGKRGKRA
jgi:hypothetical protein